MNYIGDYTLGNTVRITFTTNNVNGAAVAPSSAFEAADVKVYKDNAAFTPSGITMTSPLDSVVGLHAVDIDTSNNDGDDWAAGSDYQVILAPDETIDSQVIVSVIGSFSLQNRYMRGTDGANTVVPDAAGTAAGLHATTDGLITTIDTVVDTIAVDVAGLDGEAMRGTDGANTTVPDAAGTAAGLHATTDGLITTIDTVVDTIAVDAEELAIAVALNGRSKIMLSKYFRFRILNSTDQTLAYDDGARISVEYYGWLIRSGVLTYQADTTEDTSFLKAGGTIVASAQAEGAVYSNISSKYEGLKGALTVTADVTSTDGNIYLYMEESLDNVTWPSDQADFDITDLILVCDLPMSTDAEDETRTKQFRVN
jgi:hypothetical protein